MPHFFMLLPPTREELLEATMVRKQTRIGHGQMQFPCCTDEGRRLLQD
jgi:hypothetical protein